MLIKTRNQNLHTLPLELSDAQLCKLLMAPSNAEKTFTTLSRNPIMCAQQRKRAIMSQKTAQ